MEIYIVSNRIDIEGFDDLNLGEIGFSLSGVSWFWKVCIIDAIWLRSKYHGRGDELILIPRSWAVLWRKIVSVVVNEMVK
jgi:hypothetical protein